VLSAEDLFVCVCVLIHDLMSAGCIKVPAWPRVACPQTRASAAGPSPPPRPPAAPPCWPISTAMWVTPEPVIVTRETSRRPPDQTLRAALYGYAFNPQRRRSRAPDPVTASTLEWLARASLLMLRL
jgi:hypothetical protein